MPDRREASGAPDLFLRPEAGRFRAVALIQSFDSRRTVGACLANLVAQGLETYVFDNGSTDGSREIAEGFLGRGVLAVESVPRHGVFEHAALLARKEDVARRIDADWFVHVDTDEILRPPSGFPTVLDALRAADAGGFDAANCFEFIFSPTVEEPDHDHGRFLETMRWYYPFAPQLFHRVSAWKRRTGAIGLVETGGHDVRLPGTRVFPANLVLRHYPILSRAHAAAKYSSRTHPIAPLSRGWHGWRERLDPARVTLPSRSSLRLDDGVSPLDESRPESRHLFVADEAPPAPAPAAGSSSRPAPRALLVLGMHRSGGSALAGCLLGLGVPLGGPLSSPGLDDPSGETFELERVRRLHDALLSSFGASPLDLAPLPAGWERHPIARETRRVLGTLVDELFSSRPLWALQDPRLSILLPLWFPLLAERGIEPRFVLVQRSPGEVAHSLGKKGVPTAAALAAWLAHVENADRLTRGHVRTVVRYADLLDGPVAELERIGTALGFAWPFPPAGERARLETFLQTRRSLRQAAAPPRRPKATDRSRSPASPWLSRTPATRTPPRPGSTRRPEPATPSWRTSGGPSPVRRRRKTPGSWSGSLRGSRPACGPGRGTRSPSPSGTSPRGPCRSSRSLSPTTGATPPNRRRRRSSRGSGPPSRDPSRPANARRSSRPWKRRPGPGPTCSSSISSARRSPGSRESVRRGRPSRSPSRIEHRAGHLSL
ncbi:MAG: glycosyltransferase family 2 protein [Holophagales bacterium]|nr:glycosyltransferase family 2 protein [Holophagales bacterium]